jgi:hypothetical protein
MSDTQSEVRTEDEIPKMKISNFNPYGIITDEGVSVGSISHGRHALKGNDRKAKIAKVFAAAGRAAHELPSEYDPVAAVEALPTGLERVRRAIIDLLDGPPDDTDEPAIRSAISRLVEFLDDAGDENVSEIVDDLMLDAARADD